MFEGSIKEVLSDSKQLVEELQKKALERLVCKRAIVDTIGWLKSLKKQAESKNRHDFVEQCESQIASLQISLNAYVEMEKELSVSNSRMMTLESMVIQQTEIIRQNGLVIKNYEFEFGK